MNNYKALEGRITCPCCGYPTLTRRSEYEVCELCNWEDDGQSDVDADEVPGGPNGNYSLTEARQNFLLYHVMYRPDHDTRITGGDSPLEKHTKLALITAFQKFAVTTEYREIIATEILRLERVLRDELKRLIKEYEDRSRT